MRPTDPAQIQADLLAAQLFVTKTALEIEERTSAAAEFAAAEAEAAERRAAAAELAAANPPPKLRLRGRRAGW